MLTNDELKILRKQHDKEKISAKNYFLSNQNKLELKEFDNMVSKAIFELKSIYLHRDNKSLEQIIKELANVLKELCVILSNNVDFRDLGFGFCELSQLFLEIDISEIEPNKQKQLSILIDAMIKDIRKWYLYVFQTKYAIDIHYMDGSLMNTFLAFKELLTDEQIDSGDIILF